MTTTTDRLAAIEAREQAAIKGPWAYYDNGLDGGIVSGLRRTGSGEHSTFSCGWTYDEMVCGGERSEGRLEADDPNVPFIAAARSDIPYLLALVRKQQEALRVTTEALEAMRADSGAPSRDPYSYDSVREDAWDKGTAALASSARIMEAPDA